MYHIYLKFSTLCITKNHDYVCLLLKKQNTIFDEPNDKFSTSSTNVVNLYSIHIMIIFSYGFCYVSYVFIQ